MERTRGIEPPSQPWQGRILTIEPRSQKKMEGPTGFEPVIRVLQTHALPLGYRAATKLLYKKKFQKAIYIFLMTPTGIKALAPLRANTKCLRENSFNSQQSRYIPFNDSDGN